MSWLPIDSAPRDKVIDVWSRSYGRIVDVWWDDEDACWVCGVDDLTHWMPQPEPPFPGVDIDAVHRKFGPMGRRL